MCTRQFKDVNESHKMNYWLNNFTSCLKLESSYFLLVVFILLGSLFVICVHIALRYHQLLSWYYPNYHKHILFFLWETCVDVPHVYQKFQKCKQIPHKNLKSHKRSIHCMWLKFLRTENINNNPLNIVTIFLNLESKGNITLDIVVFIAVMTML